MKYTLPYCANRRDPAIIISFLITGNAFPVTEDHKSKDSNLVGYVHGNILSSRLFHAFSNPRFRAALKSGYGCHYVAVTPDGNIADLSEKLAGNSEVFDEIVIPQESQITPAFVLRLAPDVLDTNFPRRGGYEYGKKVKGKRKSQRNSKL